MNIKTEMTIQLRQIDAATGKVVSATKPKRNLIMDGGLNALAKSTNATYPANMFAGVRVGDGSTSDKTASGAVTFTQAATTLTASAGFFTAGMVGRIFKWGSGTGGNEVYITGYTDALNVTVDTSATVAVPAVGVVWDVTRTTLESLLYSSSTYETTAGSCQTTASGPVVTHKRTVNFPTQVASYNVNEVGYFSSTTGTTIFGRLVLSATEVVAPTNFLQVILSLVVTYSPSAPIAVVDVGTNINTAGNAMLENFNLGGTGRVLGEVQTTGVSVAASAGVGLDASSSACAVHGLIATYTQNATVGAAILNPTKLSFGASPTWTYNSVRGQMKIVTNTTISTSGQTLYGVAIMPTSTGSLTFDVKLTTPYVMPTGSFLPQVTFLVTYNRELNN